MLVAVVFLLTNFVLFHARRNQRTSRSRLAIRFGSARGLQRIGGWRRLMVRLAWCLLPTSSRCEWWECPCLFEFVRVWLNLAHAWFHVCWVWLILMVRLCLAVYPVCIYVTPPYAAAIYTVTIRMDELGAGGELNSWNQPFPSHGAKSERG